MVKGLKKISVLFLAALLFGCASREESTSFQALRPSPGYSTQEKAANDGGDAVVATAKTALGTPYVLGGTKPGGFDCSGLVMWAYNRVGVKLPRTAREQSTVGVKINNKNEMMPGDIVAFRHPKRGYHTGIYIGDGKFIHSPRKRSSVKISSLDSDYFKSTLLGARRVAIDCDDTVLLAASQLPNYKPGSGYQEISDTPSVRLPKKLKKSSRSSRKAIRGGKSAQNSGMKAVAAKKSGKQTARGKTTQVAKAKTVVKTVKTTAKTVKTAKSSPKSVKAVAQSTRAKTLKTVRIQKKGATVSMLHKKSR